MAICKRRCINMVIHERLSRRSYTLIYSQKDSAGARRGVGDVGHATIVCQLMNDRASGLDNSAATSEVLPSDAAFQSLACWPRYPYVHKHVCVYPHQ